MPYRITYAHKACEYDYLCMSDMVVHNPLCVQYVRQGDAFVLVYSIDSKQSFEEAQSMYNWITRIRDQDMPVVSYKAKAFV